MNSWEKSPYFTTNIVIHGKLSVSTYHQRNYTIWIERKRTQISVHCYNLQNPAPQWEMPRSRQSLSFNSGLVILLTISGLYGPSLDSLCAYNMEEKKKKTVLHRTHFWLLFFSGLWSPVAPSNLFLICRPNSDKP